jgi:hypothetical protein
MNKQTSSTRPPLRWEWCAAKQYGVSLHNFLKYFPYNWLFGLIGRVFSSCLSIKIKTLFDFKKPCILGLKSQINCVMCILVVYGLGY